MAYFNYHATAKKLIKEGKMIGYSFESEYHGIKPALLLIFDDAVHPVLPIRQHRWGEYIPFLPEEKELPPIKSPNSGG